MTDPVPQLAAAYSRLRTVVARLTDRLEQASGTPRWQGLHEGREIVQEMLFEVDKEMDRATRRMD